MIRKKTQLLWNLNPKKNCSTSLLRRILISYHLQKNNAPAHNSIYSKTWFSENGLEILENWPPNSPDINIIENVWSLLKKRVFQRHPKNIEELWAFCQEEFAGFF